MVYIKRIICHCNHRSKDGRKQLIAIKKNSRNFFIEVISGLCFGQSKAPDDDLIELLLNIVFTEQGQLDEEGDIERRGTRTLTPFTDDVRERDEKPIIRSFLLQLLLEHEYVLLLVACAIFPL